jgi:hypothetical protein
MKWILIMCLLTFEALENNLSQMVQDVCRIFSPLSFGGGMISSSEISTSSTKIGGEGEGGEILEEVGEEEFEQLDLLGEFGQEEFELVEGDEEDEAIGKEAGATILFFEGEGEGEGEGLENDEAMGEREIEGTEFEIGGKEEEADF